MLVASVIQIYDMFIRKLCVLIPNINHAVAPDTVYLSKRRLITMNTILTSKKGNTLTKEELLASLLSANAENNLSILYKEGKPTLVHKHNEQGPLEMITASVIFPMLMNKFIIEKSEAYTLASWLSENFAGESLSPEEPETEPVITVLDEIKATINLNPKQTKKELLAQLSSIEFLINNK